MANTIKLKRSSTASDTPSASDLEVGELAINTADAKLFTKHTDNSVKEISGSGGGGGMSDLVDDTSPSLGGTLDANGNAIDLDGNELILDADGDTSITADRGQGAFDSIDFKVAGTDRVILSSSYLRPHTNLGSSLGGGSHRWADIHAGTGNFDGDVTFNGSSYDVAFDKSANALEFYDNAKARFGGSAIFTNSDLEVYSDGTDGYIDFVGADGETLFIRNTTATTNSTDGVVIETRASTPHYVHLTNNAGINLGVFGSDKVSIIGSGSYFNHDIILNNTLCELKFRNSNNYVTLDAVAATSDTTVTLPNATGTVALLDQFGDIEITRGIKSTNDLLIARGAQFNFDDAALYQTTSYTQIGNDTGVIIKCNGQVRERIQPKDGAGGSYRVEVESAGLRLHPYSLTGTEIDPGNGDVQYKTLSANTTFTFPSGIIFGGGDSVYVLIDNGTGNYTVTWPTITWMTGSAPTLNNTGYTHIVIWRPDATLGFYGAKVG